MKTFLCLEQHLRWSAQKINISLIGSHHLKLCVNTIGNFNWLIINNILNFHLDLRATTYTFSNPFIFTFVRNWTVNHDVGCKGYFELEAEITDAANLTSTHTYCNEKDTKYCQTKCPEIKFSELQCALPRCPNITKDRITAIYPKTQGAKLQSDPLPDERFNIGSSATFECIETCKKYVFLLIYLV